MKKLYFSFLFLAVFQVSVFSQTVTDIVTAFTGGGSNYYMELYGSDLYFTQLSQGKLSKVDLTDTTFAVVDVLTGLVNPISLATKDSDLYIGLADGGGTSGRIVKIDLTAATPMMVDVVPTGIGNILEMKFHGDDLYWAEFNNQNRIAKADVTDTTGAIVDIVTAGINPIGLEIIGDDLYFSESASSRVSKIDLNDSTFARVDVVTMDLSFPAGLEAIGNDLYITELTSGDVSVADVGGMLPATPTAVVTGRTSPLGVLFDSDNNWMYISQQDGTIARFNVFPVSTDNLKANPDWNIFPNPASEFVQFKGLENQSFYQIINSTGQIVQEGTASPNETLSVNNLATGGYVLRLENGELRRFIKL